MYKEDLALNNQQQLICHKTKPINQISKLSIDKPIQYFGDHLVLTGTVSYRRPGCQTK